MVTLKPGVKNVVLTPGEMAALMYHIAGGDYGHNFLKMGVQQYAIGITIMMRESGGNTAAFRPARLNPDGGNDRGIWQINDKYHPAVTDPIAFNPAAATEYVRQITSVPDPDATREGSPSLPFRKWDPWKTSGPIVPSPAGLATATAWMMKTPQARDLGDKALLRKLARANIPAPGREGEIDYRNPITNLDPLGDLDDVAIAIGKRLLSVGFWKTIGLGVLGIALLLVGVGLFNKDAISGAAMTAATKGM